MSQFLQILFSGLTVGAVYAMVAIGFTLIYAASDVVNFAQGEFVMLGGMLTWFLLGFGMPLVAAAAVAVAATVLVGVLLQKLAIEQAREASVVALIVITLGASNVLRGAAGLMFDKDTHSIPDFSGSKPLEVLGATLLPQSLWVLGGSLVMFLALWVFLNRTLTGKAMRAVATNRMAAQLVGIDVRSVLLLAFGLSAALGAIGGILIAPITLTRYSIGAMLALKGFAAAIFGGLGNPIGAAIGGLALGVLEAFAAGYVTSGYKDGVAFVVLIGVLFFMPGGLLGAKSVERV
jgi:branched-chain amino acid transport system permease protein